jgi:hypothetical protein
MRVRSRGYYFGKNLSQGHLGIKDICSQAAMQDSGLLQLMLELEDRNLWEQWVDRVVELLTPSKSTKRVNETTHLKLRHAVVIAEGCFPGQ